MSKSVEVKPNVFGITPETTQWPAGGATVQIGKEVSVNRRLDFGPIATRGVNVRKEDGHPSEPVKQPSSPSDGIYNMNA